MKKLIYQIAGYTEVYNPETEKVEQQPCPATVVIENATDADIEKAKEIAWGGEYTVEDDGQPEAMTDAQRIAQLEEALELLLSGVTE